MFEKEYLVECLKVVDAYGVDVLVLDNYGDEEIKALHRALKALFTECDGK